MKRFLAFINNFKGIQIFAGNLMPKSFLWKNSSDIILPIPGGDNGVPSSSKSISLKVNLIARLEFELAYYDVAVQPRDHENFSLVFKFSLKRITPFFFFLYKLKKLNIEIMNVKNIHAMTSSNKQAKSFFFLNSTHCFLTRGRLQLLSECKNFPYSFISGWRAFDYSMAMWRTKMRRILLSSNKLKCRILFNVSFLALKMMFFDFQ